MKKRKNECLLTQHSILFELNADCVGHIGHFLGGITWDICTIWSCVSKQFQQLAWTYWQKTLSVPIHFVDSNAASSRWAEKYGKVVESAEFRSEQSAMRLDFPNLKSVLLQFDATKVHRVPSLSRFANLQTVHLYDITNGSLDDINLPNLQELILTRCDLIVRNVPRKSFPHLLKVTLYVDNRNHFANLDFILHLPCLEDLTLGMNYVPSLLRIYICELRHLTSLTLICYNVDEIMTNLDFLTSLTRLRHLELRGFTRLTDITALTKLISLRTVRICNSPRLREIDSLLLLKKTLYVVINSTVLHTLSV